MLISLLERQNISVAHIQETHWSFSSTWSTDSFHCIHSGATKKGTAGVLTLIRKDLCKSTQIKFQHVVPGRLLLVRFPMGQTFLNLINVYQIFVQHPDKEDSLQFQRSQLLHHLDCLIQSIPRRHLLLISGDFNGRLRPTGSLVGRAVGQSSAPEDEELHAVIECHDLCVVNTWGSGQTHSNNFAGRTSMIDFVMIRREHADNRAKQVFFLHAHPLHPPRPSFHIPMVTSFTSFWRCWASPAGRSQCQRPDVDQFLADVAVQAPRYKRYLHLLDQALKQGDPCDLDLDEVVSKVAKQLYPGMTHDTPPSLQAALAAHVQTGWTLWSRLHRLRGSSLRVMFRGWSIAAKLLRHRKLHRKHHRQVRRARLAQLMQQASEAAKLGDQRALHKVIRLLAPKQTRVKLQLRNSSGYLMSDDEEALHIRQHMESLYVDKGAENPEDKYCSSLPFSEFDLYKSLGDLPARKNLLRLVSLNQLLLNTPLPSLLLFCTVGSR